MNFDLVEKYKNAGNRLLLLDYDGTLVDYNPKPNQATLGPHILNILSELIQNESNKLVIVTGRNAQDIEKLIGNLPIDIIAEHGAAIRKDGIWSEKIQEDTSWKNKVMSLFDKVTSTCPNSFIEEKHFSVAWHYRNCDPKIGKGHSEALIRVLEIFVQAYDLDVYDGNKLVEVVTKKINKGLAIQYLFENKSYDYVLCIGDDITDEYMFEYLSSNKHAYTIKVGEQDTVAHYRFNSTYHVVMLLEKLAL